MSQGQTDIVLILPLLFLITVIFMTQTPWRTRGRAID